MATERVEAALLEFMVQQRAVNDEAMKLINLLATRVLALERLAIQLTDASLKLNAALKAAQAMKERGSSGLLPH